MRRLLTPLASASAMALFCGAAPAVAAPLIGFTDNSFASASTAFLSDLHVNWVGSWTQTTASTGVTLSAILSSHVGVTTAQWYVTTAIGPGTTIADVVHSGSYSPSTPDLDPMDFNVLARTVLGTGLDFAAGTYYLVLDGPAGGLGNNADWIGDAFGVTTTLAAGYSVGPYYAASSFAGNTPNDFAPASPFVPGPTDLKFVFELQDGAVPSPSVPALLLAAVGAALAARRRTPGR